MFDEMDKIVNTFDGVISNITETEEVVISDLLHRDFEDHGIMVVGFECAHCNYNNLFDGDDADYMEAHGIKMYKKVECEHCEKESQIDDS